jgi:hypothetical protein
MSTDHVPSERVRSILDELIRNRQQLERDRSDAGLLEANRLGIVYWQLQLSRSLAAELEAPGAAA